MAIADFARGLRDEIPRCNMSSERRLRHYRSRREMRLRC